MLLDQIALQNQSFQLRVCDNVLETCDLRNHFLDLRSLIAAALKILAHTVFQADGLTDINDLIVFVVHDINSRRTREFF